MTTLDSPHTQPNVADNSAPNGAQMRRYGSVPISFYEMREFRALSLEAKAIYPYLRSCRSSNAIGLYRLPQVLVEHDLDMKAEMVSHAYDELSHLDLICFDPDTDFILIPDMAEYEIGQRIGQEDRRRHWVMELLEVARGTILVDIWRARYGARYLLEITKYSTSDGEYRPLTSPLQGATVSVAVESRDSSSSILPETAVPTRARAKREPKSFPLDHPIKAILTEYDRLFLLKSNGEPAPQPGAKEASLIKRLLGRYDQAQIIELLGKYFESTDEFIRQAGYALQVFPSQIPKLLLASQAGNFFSPKTAGNATALARYIANQRAAYPSSSPPAAALSNPFRLMRLKE